MRIVAMVSGGKDSCYNMMQCVAEGHEIVALANVHPKDKDELDSYMYQTVGHMGIELLAEAMELPLYRIETNGKTTQFNTKHYVPQDDDEVEDLYNLLKSVRDELNCDAVAVGAIFSDYQRIRVENVCARLNLISLAYLWRRDQTELLQEMIDCQVHAIVIKVAALGLQPDRHLGKSIRDIQPYLLQMKDKYGLNVCGEGGEYETFTLNCPLFKKEIIVDDMQSVISSTDSICPIGYINFTKLRLIPKNENDKNTLNTMNIKTSLDYIVDLNESSYNDLSDPDLSESELEQIEKENRLKEITTIVASSSSSSSSPSSTSASNQQQSQNINNNDSTQSMNGINPKCSNNNSSSNNNNHNNNNNNIGSNGVISSTSTTTTTTTTTTTQLPITIKTDFKVDKHSITEEIQPEIDSIPIISESTVTDCEKQQELLVQQLNNKPNVACNRMGWMWISGIQGYGNNCTIGMDNALKILKDLIELEKYELNDICYITLYVRKMSEYPMINKSYANMFNFTNPPTRVCVELTLPINCHVVIEAVAFQSKYELHLKRNSMANAAQMLNNNNNDGINDCQQQNNNNGNNGNGNGNSNKNKNMDMYQRQTMYVQGISHWAPANIGPYSQSTRIGEIIYISGQIALVPGSMVIIDGGIRPQCKLTLRHISRIAMAMNCVGQLRDVVHGICFVTDQNFISEARRQWERRTTNAIVDYIVVPTLPRKALVEWQVWAHTHNDKFDYEETGCSIGDYNVFSRKRWNYENNCAAIVCYVSTGLATSTTQLTDLNECIIQRHQHLSKQLTKDNILEILRYTFNKLLKGYTIGKSSDGRSSSPIITQQSTLTSPSTSSSSSSNNNNNNNKPTENELIVSHSQQSSMSGQNITAQPPVVILPAIHLKIFYQLTVTPDVNLLIETIDEFKLNNNHLANVAFTVLPAVNLQNFSTFLSICGVRHE